jgi:hypothetical protein
MNFFNPSDIQAIAALVNRLYDSEKVHQLYATVEEDYQTLLRRSPVEEEVLQILVYKKHDDGLIDLAIKDQTFLDKFMVAGDLVAEFHKKYEGSLWRLIYCTQNYKEAGAALILNNLGKAAVLLQVKPPFAF